MTFSTTRANQALKQEIQTDSNPIESLSASREAVGKELFNNVLSFQNPIENGGRILWSTQTKDIPMPNLDPDTASVVLSALLSSVSDVESKGKMKIIISNMNSTEELNKEIFKKMSENIKKAAEIAKQQRSAQISKDASLGLSTAAAIFGMIGAALFTLATGGAGVGALIIASFSVTQAVMGVADRIAQATDAKITNVNGEKVKLKISWEGMVESITDYSGAIPQSIKDKGPAEVNKYKQELAMGFSMAISLTLAIASIALGAGSILSAGDKIGKAVKEAASLSEKVGRQVTGAISQITEMTSTMAEIGDSFSQAVSAGYGISIADINFNMKQADNQKNFQLAMKDQINKFLESNRQSLEKNIEWLSSSFEMLGSIVADVRDTGSRSVSSMGRV